ncbi:hypothetical protein [Streptomyces sp. NPDC051577]|uniref:hypothetical protein n=1 Tax=Streptomyces sp. NPDC051577 TaxID=3155166 RepID=UPI0034479B1E
MTLYRATDAADTMNTAAMLIAAYCQDTDMAKNELDGFLQLGQQRNRAWGARDADRAQLAGLLGRPVHRSGSHGLQARLCDDVDALDDYPPPHIARMACRVAEVLEEPQPATP